MKIITSNEINDYRDAIRNKMRIATSEQERDYLYKQLQCLSNSKNCGALPITNDILKARAENGGIIGYGSTKQAHCLRVDANKRNLNNNDMVVVLTQAYGNKGYGNQSYLQAHRFMALQVLFDENVCNMFLPVFRLDNPRGRGNVDGDDYIKNTIIVVPRADKITENIKSIKQDEINKVFACLQSIGFFDCSLENLGYLPAFDKIVCIDYGANFGKILDEYARVIDGKRARR